MGLEIAIAGELLALVIDIFDVECMDVPGNHSARAEISLASRAGGRMVEFGARGSRRRESRNTYPRMVRQMLTRRSAPQPATRKTPRGGTWEE